MELFIHALYNIIHRLAYTDIGVAKGCTGCTCTPRAEKKIFWAKFTGESCKCTPRQRVHPGGRARVQFFEEIGEIWTVEEVI